MKAILWTNYGPPEVLRLGEVEKPMPKDDEVLIRVHAATAMAGDCEMRRLQLPMYLGLPLRLYVGVRRPTRITIPGMELAGEIEAVGGAVRHFQVGERVFGISGFRMGAYAEYICLPIEPDETTGALAKITGKLSYAEAAAIPVGGSEALHFLRRANLRGGEEILINGAGGSIGTFAVQLAKLYGASVTAVDSTGKLEMLRSIGADQVIDYTREDFTRGGERYDVIFDVVGKSPFGRSVRALKENGRYLLANPHVSHLARGRWVTMTSNKRVITGTASYRSEDLMELQELIETGKLRVVIDRRYPLEQAAEAHRYVETGAKKGGVVIMVDDTVSI